MRSARDRLRSRAGQSLPEYVVLLALVAMGLIIVLVGFGTNLQSIYTATSKAMATIAAESDGGGGGGTPGGVGAVDAGAPSSSVGGGSTTGGGGGSTSGGGGSTSGGGAGGSQPTPGVTVPQ